MGDLGDRMKGYENVSRFYLTKRMPAIIRIDGKSFHTYTKNLSKPWNQDFVSTMLETTKYLCENISGSKIAYWQSNEISILITDYDDINTQAWFDKNIQKIVSVSASIATASFNRLMEKYFCTIPSLAFFDSRVFVLPKEDVCNYFVWRQQDATRNSVQGLAQSNFSHKQLHSLNISQLQDKLMIEKNINWNDCLTWQKRGACAVKENYFLEGGVERSKWIIDWEIPIFTQDRNYIERFV